MKESIRNEIQEIEKLTNIELKDWSPLKFAQLTLQGVNIGMSKDLLKYLSENDEISEYSKIFFLISYYNKQEQEIIEEIDEIMEIGSEIEIVEKLIEIFHYDELMGGIISSSQLILLEKFITEESKEKDELKQVWKKFPTTEEYKKIFNKAFDLVEKITDDKLKDTVNEGLALALAASIMNSISLSLTFSNDNHGSLDHFIVEVDRFNAIMETVSVRVKELIKQSEELKEKFSESEDDGN